MITPRERERLDEAARRFVERQEAAIRAGMNVDLMTLNRAAAGRVRATGFPHKAHERFTYVDTASLVEAELSWRPAPPAPAVTATTAQVLLVDGRFVSKTGPLAGTPGATVRPLGDALREEPPLNALLAARGVQEEDLFASLADASILDGALVDLPAGASSFAPVTVDLVGEAEEGSVTHPRLVVRVGAGAHGTLLIRTVGDRAGYYENALIDLIVDDGATVEALVIGDDHPAGRRLLRLRGGIGGSGSLGLTFLTLGAAAARTSFDVTLDGPHASAKVAHLATLAGTAESHVWGRITHRAADGASRMLFKNVVSGTAHASVDAAVVVEPAGSGADSRQEIHSLLLDAGARADAKPTLSIGNDDVVCSHGATVGQLDEEALLYLRSRGLAESVARSTLVDAFRREVAEWVENMPLRGFAFDALKTGGGS